MKRKTIGTDHDELVIQFQRPLFTVVLGVDGVGQFGPSEQIRVHLMHRRPDLIDLGGGAVRGLDGQIDRTFAEIQGVIACERTSGVRCFQNDTTRRGGEDKFGYRFFETGAEEHGVFIPNKTGIE